MAAKAVRDFRFVNEQVLAAGVAHVLKAASRRECSRCSIGTALATTRVVERVAGRRVEEDEQTAGERPLRLRPRGTSMLWNVEEDHTGRPDSWKRTMQAKLAALTSKRAFGVGSEEISMPWLEFRAILMLLSAAGLDAEYRGMSKWDLTKK
eukprot:scpid14671/ scgid34330/ 